MNAKSGEGVSDYPAEKKNLDLIATTTADEKVLGEMRISIESFLSLKDVIFGLDSAANCLAQAGFGRSALWGKLDALATEIRTLIYNRIVLIEEQSALRMGIIPETSLPAASHTPGVSQGDPVSIPDHHPDSEKPDAL